MFSGSSRKRDNDERSSVSLSSRHGHDKKKREVSRSTTPYSASHAPPPPPGLPPEASSEERILTPDEEDDSDVSDATHLELYDEPKPSKGKNPPIATVMLSQSSSGNSGKGNTPDIFKGPRDNLDTFLTQCRLYFFLNGDKFDTKDKKTIFIVSYMRGTAYATFEKRLSEYLAGTASNNTKRLFMRLSRLEAELNLVFGSVDKKRAAKRELHMLKQRTAAKDYTANFQRLTAGLNWNDKSLIS